jgi:RHS repeat-associated protein
VLEPGGGHWQFSYDSSHHLTTMRSPRFYGDTMTTPSPVVTNHYDGQGRVDWQSDPLGRRTSFDYTTASGSTIVTDPKGNMVKDTYAYGLLVEQMRGYGSAQPADWQYTHDETSTALIKTLDPNGHVWLATVDARGNRLSTVDPLQRTTSATYNSLNLPVTRTDGKNVTTTLTYDGAGNPISVTTPWREGPPNTNRVTSFGYADPSHPGDVTSITDPDGKVWRLTYDAAGNIRTQADPLGNTAVFCYDSIGRRMAVISPSGQAAGVTCATPQPAAFVTYFTYNVFGDLLTQTDPLGHVATRAYDADRNLKSIKDADNHQTSYDYDAAEQLLAMNRPDSTARGRSYWPDGELKTQTDGANHTTSYTYDPLGRVATVTDPLNRIVTYSYDNVGNLLSKQDHGGQCAAVPKLRCTTYTYDDANEVSSVAYSDGLTPGVTSIAYDANGQRTAMTDGTGTSSWTWDSLHRLRSYTNGANKTVGFGYNLRGAATSVTYPGATGAVSKGYDDAGRLQTVTDWLANQTTFNYDGDSFMTSEVYPNGTTATFTPDGADRLSAVSDAPTANPNSAFATFGYGRDPAALITSTTTTGVPSDAHSYGYSSLSQLTTVDSSSYAFDAADNLTGLLDGTTQSFDAADQLTGSGKISFVGNASSGGSSSSSLTVPLPASTAANDQILVAATLPFGKSVSSPTGYTVVGTYSSGTANTSAKVVVYRRTAVAGDASVTVSFTGKFDKAVTVAVYRGVSTTNPIDTTSTGATAGGTSVTAPSLTTSAAGDRLVVVDGGVNASATGSWTPPTGMSSRVQQASGTSTVEAMADQTLTAAGATGTRVSTFSQNAQLVSVLIAFRPAQATYGYDSNGDRRTVTLPGGPTTTLAYDQARRLVGYGSTATYEYNGEGLRMSKAVSGSTSQFSWDVSGESPLILDDGANRYVYGSGGRPVEQVSASGIVTYLHQDQLGSTRAATDSSGATVATFTYDAFGKLTASTGTVTTPLAWAGEYRDAESGFVYLRARSYDPGTGQFLTRDPIESVTQEPYQYAGNDPLNNIDPSGLNWLSDRARDIGSAMSAGAQGVVRGAEIVGEAAQDTGEWAWRNRGTIATIGALGSCLLPGVGLVGCGYAAVTAFGVRAEQRIEEQGFSNSLGANVTDAGLTYLTLGLGGAFEALAGDWGGVLRADELLGYLGRLIPAGYDVANLFGWLNEEC